MLVSRLPSTHWLWPSLKQHPTRKSSTCTEYTGRIDSLRHWAPRQKRVSWRLSTRELHRRSRKVPPIGHKSAHRSGLSARAVLAPRNARGRLQKWARRSSQILCPHYTSYRNRDPNTTLWYRVIPGSTSRLAQNISLQGSPEIPWLL